MGGGPIFAPDALIPALIPKLGARTRRGSRLAVVGTRPGGGGVSGGGPSLPGGGPPPLPPALPGKLPGGAGSEAVGGGADGGGPIFSRGRLITASCEHTGTV